MAITLVGATQENKAVATWTQTTSIAVLTGDVFLVAAIVGQSGTVSRVGTNLPVMNGAGTATIDGVVRRVTNNPGSALAGQVELAAWTGRVSGDGDLKLDYVMPGSRDGRYLVAVFRGVDNGTPLVGAGTTSNGTSTAPTSAAVSPGKAGDWVLGLMGHQPTASTITSTSTWTDILKYNSPSSGSNAQGNLLERLEATSTSPVASAPTISTSLYWAHANLVLNAAPEVVPGTVISRGSFF